MSSPSKDEPMEIAEEAPAKKPPPVEDIDMTVETTTTTVTNDAAAAAAAKNDDETAPTLKDPPNNLTTAEKAAEPTTDDAPAAAKAPPAAAAVAPATVTVPSLINLNEWDKTWEEQYERRKRRKVIPDALPPYTIGRGDDPLRLNAGPCMCQGPCHLNDQCPCNHMGLFCTETCRCKSCENNLTYAEGRHRALVQAIQNGHRPVVHECCPCAPQCDAGTCPCAFVGQRCRHTQQARTCRNPCGAELTRPLGTKKQQGPLAMCLRVTPPRKKTGAAAAAKLLDKKPAAAAAAASPSSDAKKASSAAAKSAASSKTSSATAVANMTPTPPTSIQKAWDAADAAADMYFRRGAAAASTAGSVETLQSLYEVAANAAVAARSELKLNQAERWWWRDVIPSAASPARRTSSAAAALLETEEELSLECLEPYNALRVEKDVTKQERCEAIIQVSQETLILRYAAMVLRQKARDLAAQRLQRQDEASTATGHS